MQQMNGPPGLINGDPGLINGDPGLINGPPGLINGPPGLINVSPLLLVEKYAWVDARLEEMCARIEESECQPMNILTEDTDWLEKWSSLDDAINKTTTTIQRMLFRDTR